MANPKLGNLIINRISKEATRDGLQNHAERLADQLETALHQIDELTQEIDAINELQAESSDDPETQDPPHIITPIFTPDLEPVNHSEDI